jgi:hypothetical protein
MGVVMGTQHSAATSHAGEVNTDAVSGRTPAMHSAWSAWRSTIGLCAVVSIGAVSLLLWSKLKLVTNVPRTAYAVPEERSDNTNDASHDTSKRDLVEKGATESPEH